MEDLSKNLNCFGITLNLIAGVLLAPEAIGIERIREWQQALEVASQSILKKIDNAYGFLNWAAQGFEMDLFDSHKG